MDGHAMSTCSVCGRLSASGGDHTDCGEMRRARLEDEGRRAAARYELLGAAGVGRGGTDDDLAVEMRAILDHIGGGVQGAPRSGPAAAGGGCGPPSAPGRSA